MLSGNEHYVIVKLISGEQVMAVLDYENETQIHIVNPLLIRMFPIVGATSGQEHVTATPFCKFADNPSLTIDKSKVLFMKNLHHVLIPHFNRIVEEHSREVLVSKQPTAEDLVWGDEEEETVEQLATVENLNALTEEEVRKRIDMLKSIIDENKNFVDGNETIH